MNDMYQNENELYHYGVKGMRWGVRRATKQLSRSSDSESRNKAIQTLNKHKSKGSAKLSSLEKRRVKLDDTLRKATTKDKAKAAEIESKATKLDQKAAKNRQKASKWYTSSGRAMRLINNANRYEIKSEVLHTKASKLNANYEKAKAKVDANESMQKAFRTELSKIDSVLVETGRRYING